MSDYTPTTEEVREAWIYYKCMAECNECPAEFDRWLYAERERVYNMMASIERQAERERCTDIMDKLTGHYAQTHYAGKVCYICDIFAAIYEGS